MGCLINIVDGDIKSVTVPGGGKSPLYQKIRDNITNDKEEALQLWAQIYLPEFKGWFGLDWEARLKALRNPSLVVQRSTDTETSNIPIGRLNIAGEPQMIFSKGRWVFKNGRNEEMPLVFNAEAESMVQARQVREKDNVSQQVYKELADKLSDRFDVEYTFVDRPKDTRAGWFEDGKVFLNTNRVTSETLFHEFGHPLVRAFKTSNPEVYKSLANEVVKDTDLMKEVESKNPKLSGDLLIEEAVVTQLGRKASTAKTLNLLKQFWAWVKNFLNDAFDIANNTINVASIPHATIADLAALMNMNTKVEFDRSILEDPDFKFNMATTAPGPDVIQRLKEINKRAGLVVPKETSGKGLVRSFYIIDGSTQLDRLTELVSSPNKGEDGLPLSAFRIVDEEDGEIVTFAEKQAKTEFRNLFRTKVIDPKSVLVEDDEEYTLEQRIKFYEDKYERGRLYGKIVHAHMQILLEKNAIKRDVIQTNINQWMDEMEAAGETFDVDSIKWLEDSFITIIERSGIATNAGRKSKLVLSSIEDKIEAEMPIFSRFLKIGTTLDGLIVHPDKELTIIDWKAGALLNDLTSGTILKFGTTFGLTDNKLTRAKLEVMFRAMMIKEHIPEARFKTLSVNHLSREHLVDIHHVDYQKYLSTIAAFVKKERSDVFEEMSKKGLFDYKNYLGTEKVVTDLERATNKLSLDEKNAYLVARGHALHLKNTAEEIRKNPYLQREAALIGETFVAINKQPGVHLNRDEGDLGAFRKYLSTFGDISHPAIRTFFVSFSKRRDFARKQIQIERKEADDLMKVVLKEHLQGNSLANTLSTLSRGTLTTIPFIGGLKIKELYAFMWRKNNSQNSSGQYLNRKDTYQKEGREVPLSKAQKAYRDHVVEKMHAKWKVIVNKEALHPITGLPVLVKDLFAGTMPETLEADFMPRTPKPSHELREEGFKSWTKKALGAWANRNLSFFIERNFYNAGETKGGVPLRFMQKNNSPIIVSENHSFDAHKSFLQFMNNLILKDNLDDMYIIGESVKSFLELKTNKDGKPLYPQLASFLEDKILLDIVDVPIGENLLSKDIKYTITSKHPLALAGVMEPGQYKLNVGKIMLSIKHMTSGISMMVKPVAGIANGGLIFMLNAMEASKNSLAGVFGVAPDDLDLTIGTLFEAHAAYFTDYLPKAFIGKAHESKIWQMAVQHDYLTDNYDYSIKNSELLGAKNPLFDTANLYWFHTVFENYGNLMLMHAQMKMVKAPDGKSMWDHYKLNPKNGQWEYTGPSRGIIEVAPGVFEERKGFTIQEILHMKRISERIHGSYRRDERVVLERMVLGQWMLQFKKFVPTLIRNLVGGRQLSGSLGKWRPKLDSQGRMVQNKGMTVYEWEQKVMQGRIRFLMAYLGANISDKFGFYDEVEGNGTFLQRNLTPEDKVQLAHIAVTVLVVMFGSLALGGFPDDDKNKYYYKRLQRLFQEDLTQGANPVDLLKFIDRLLAPASRLLKMAQAGQEFFLEGLLFGERTKDGTIRGINQILNNIPIIAGIRQLQQVINETFKEDLGWLGTTGTRQR